MTISLSQPLKLPCGAELPNRIAKSAMTEGLADEYNRATEDHVRLYRAWSHGGTGLHFTGNVHVNRGYLERSGNVAIDGNGGLEMLRRYAKAGTEGGNHLWVQLAHAGRQSPATICPEPICPSPVPLKNFTKETFNDPREITVEEIHDTIERFAHAAEVCRETGFTGIQFHSAHGYLLSSFLSPITNQRTDEWGGSLENRTRLLRTVYAEARKRVGADYPISVKINSADFQRGGFDHEESLQVVKTLGELGFDLIEISGGNYEEPAVLYGERDPAGNVVRASTKAREGYFLKFAEEARKVTKAPLMVTGGFRSKASMTEALESGALDVVGIARPLCTDVNASKKLIEGTADRIDDYEKRMPQITSEELGGASELETQQANMFADIGWWALQLVNLGQGKEPDPSMSRIEALQKYIAYETMKNEAWKGPGATPADEPAATAAQ